MAWGVLRSDICVSGERSGTVGMCSRADVTGPSLHPPNEDGAGSQSI